MPHDPSLSLPAGPAALPTLSGPADALAYAGPARPRPFLLAVAGCSARGIETRGNLAVEQEGRLLLSRLDLVDAAGGNVLLAPAHARRELIAAGGTWMEALLVTVDGLAAQWTPTGAAPARLVFSLPAERWHAVGAQLRADAGDGVRMVRVLPAPSWSVRETRSGLVVSVEVALAPGEALRLIAASGADVAKAEARLKRLARASDARAENELAGLRTRRLATVTGVAELDDGLAWAAARIDAASDAVHELAIGEPCPLDPDARRAWTALGRLASGARDRTLVDPGSPLGALALARRATWRGERVSAVDAPPFAPADGAERVANRAALFALADAVEPWAKERGAELRARAASPAAAAGSRLGSGRRLPTLGGGGAPLADPLATALAAALEVPGEPSYAPPTEDPPPGIARALAAWACLNAGALDRGFALFRRHLADGFADGAGLWGDGDRIHDPAAAAMVPLVFLEGLLGGRGDAHYGRLRLSPRLPGHWVRLGVTGIVLGDAEVALDYEMDAGRHLFRVEQRAGAVPLMLIFEPVVAADLGAPIRVDGEQADLALTPYAGRAQARVQLPLDRARAISIG